MEIAKGASISFEMADGLAADSVEVELRLLPTHAVEGDALRIRVTFDGQQSPVTDYETHGRSEEWKQNVLRGQALRDLPINLSAGRHTMTIHALDSHIVVDQWQLKAR